MTKFKFKRIASFLTVFIIAFAGASCTQNQSGGAVPDGHGTFLVGPEKPCDAADHSGDLSNGGPSGVVGAVTTDANYSSSALWALDVASDRFCPVANGEAGDLFLTAAGDGLALFSRNSPQLNYTVFTAVGRTAQQATPFAENGDPHALRVFRDNGFVRWLIALNTAGKLVEFDPVVPRDGAVVVPEDFSRASPGRVFRPVDVIVVKGEEIDSNLLKASNGKADSDYIFALHQGLDPYYRSNYSQAIYAWRRVGPGQYAEVDLDKSKGGINGFPLRFSNPSGFIQKSGRLSFLSLCFSTDANCLKGLEYIDLKEIGNIQQTHLVTDFSGNAIFSNGLTATGAPVKLNSNDKPVMLAFSSVQMSSGKKIVSIDIASGALQTIHTFDAAGSAYYGLVYDQVSSNLLVGDTDGTRALMWAYPIGPNGKASGKAARYVLASPGQPYPMQLVLLNKN